jgi:hypothetical protein
VRILNSAGGTFTSRARAIKYLASRRARYVDERTIEMIEDHRQHRVAVASAHGISVAADRNAHSPTLEIVAPVRTRLKVLCPYGYLHYPHRDQTSSGRLKRNV